MIEFVRTIALSLAALGLLVATYISAGIYGWRRLHTTLSAVLPPALRIDPARTTAPYEHSSSRLLGLPHSVYGMAFYFLVLVTIATGSTALLWITRIASVFTLLLTSFLVFMLIRRHRQPCILCHATHIINAALAVLLWNVPAFWEG